MDVFDSGGRTCVSVADEGGPSEPVVTEAGEWDESGRGLHTVALLADSWGRHGNDRGRTVTAIFATGRLRGILSEFDDYGAPPAEQGSGFDVHSADPR